MRSRSPGRCHYRSSSRLPAPTVREHLGGWPARDGTRAGALYPCNLFFLLSAEPCALNTVGWNACHHVPRCSFETDPLIKPKPAITPAGLGHLKARNGGAKVTPKRLRRSGVIAALPCTPLGPSLEQLRKSRPGWG